MTASMEYIVKDGRNVCHRGPVIIQGVRHRIDSGFVVCEPGLNSRAWNVTEETTVCPLCFPVAEFRPAVQLDLFGGVV